MSTIRSSEVSASRSLKCISTVVSQKRAQGRYTLLCAQTRGWADICNIAAFYHEKAPMFTLSQPTTGYCTPTHPVLLAAVKFWIAGGDASYHKAMNRSVRNHEQQPTAKAHHHNSSNSGSRRKYCWTCS